MQSAPLPSKFICMLHAVVRVRDKTGLAKITRGWHLCRAGPTNCSQVSPAGDAAPEPREGHCACILSHYLLVAGGMQLLPTGPLRLLGDLHARHTMP